MQALVMADMRRIDMAAPLCRTNGYGLETQVLVNPFLMEEDGWLDRHRNMMEGLWPLALHAPFEGVDIGSGDADVQAFTRKQLLWACEISGQLKAEHIVVHGDGAAAAEDFPAWKARALETMRWLADESSDRLHFYLENTPMAMVDQMLAVYTELDHPKWKLNLDVGHAFLEPDQRPVEWIKILGDRIGYSHMNSNDGKADRHQGLHEGGLPSYDICVALNEHAPNAIWSLEVDAGAFVGTLEWLGENGFLPAPLTIPQNLPS